MRKSKFIKSTIILLIGGMLTKILGMVIKIITTRLIGTKALGLYMMIMPTFNLFITLAQLGFPVAVSKIVSEDKKENKKVIFNCIFISLIITFILMLILIFSSSSIAKFLHNDKLYYPILAIGFTLPFISISGIIRGYFFGREKMIPHVVSNAVEQISRIILNIICLPFLVNNFSVIVTITFLVLSNIISELVSIFILYFFLPKKIIITKDMIKPDYEYIKDVLNISLPTTGSRVIGTIGYFFEPILLTTFLLLNNYTNDYITYEYGIITGYVMPLLMLPSFFSMAISNAYANNKILYVKEKIKQSLSISLFIGLIFTIFIMLYPEFFMNLIYGTTDGVNYIRIIAPFFLFYYIQVPITTILQALNKSKEAMLSTLVGIFIKLGLIISLSYMHIGIYSLIIGTIVNMIYVTIFNYIKVKKIFK